MPNLIRTTYKGENMKHTGGMWRVKESTVITDQPTKDWNKYHPFERKREIESYGGDLVAESIFNDANARLIASAPKLLEACKKAHGWVKAESKYSNPMGIKEVLNTLQQAIASAT